MATALVIHGHFYQPPRENPWTNRVEREHGAEPFHDWNERIYHECYRPNAYARIFDDHGRIERIVNNYRHLSFNFGPTLLSWMERHHPLTYARILEADRESVSARGGHGNAIAQAYNHTILPLMNARDRRTQVRWGIRDFERRFGRAPEAMWLPETACDDATLAALIDEGLRFVILSPHQAERTRRMGDEAWHSVRGGTIDCGVPYRYFHRDGSRRHIDVFFYDADRSRAIAFEGALVSSHVLVDHFSRAKGGPGRVVSTATDGETYGHHSKWGDRCLAHTMEVEARKRGFWLTNFGEFLERFPPKSEVEIAHGPDGLGTSWSCAHGVGRWFRDCGCATGGGEGWTQAWRGPLRKALDLLRDHAGEHFESAGGELLLDPWAARDAYIDVILDAKGITKRAFVERHQRKQLGDEERFRALALLEMQRHAQLMYTSCGWFFSEISGIETTQILKYAGRVLDLLQELGAPSAKEPMLEVLAEAKSNKNILGNGADIFRRVLESSRVTPERVAAHLTISSLVDEYEDAGEIDSFTYRRESYAKREDGRIELCTGRITLRHDATERKSDSIVCGMHFGGVDFYCVVSPYPGEERFKASLRRVWEAFPTASLPMMLRLAQEEFGPEEYGLEHILPDARERISEIVFRDLVQRFLEDYARLYEQNRRTIEMLQKAGFELPKELRAAAEFTLGRLFEEEVRSQHQSQDPAAYKRALEIASEVAERGYHIDRRISSQIFTDMINARVLAAVTHAAAEDVGSATGLIQLTRKLGVTVDLESAEEAVHDALARRAKMEREILAPLAAALGIAPAAITGE